MKEDEIDKLIKKYKEGNSDLNEEQLLFKHIKNTASPLDAWSSYVENNKIKSPANLNDSLWESFQNKQHRKRRIFIGIMSAAASIMLLIALFVANSGQENNYQEELSYAEKEALLNQVLEMVSDSDSEEVQQNVIYENDLVIIYTTTEK